MTHRLLTCLTGAILMSLAGPLAAQDDVGPDTIVATVGETEITLGNMIALRARLPQDYAQMPDDALFEAIREQLVQQAALAERADGESRAIELTLENERRTLLANDALEAALAETVTEEAAREAYDAQFAQSGPAFEYNASHILVETQEEAQAIIAEIEGGADFATLARERSTGPSAPQGGELGWFGPGMMVQPFEEAVAALEVGDISAPVQSQFGWHVISLDDRREQAPPEFEAVRAQIEGELRAEAAQQIIAETVESADVALEDISGIDPSVLSDMSLISGE